MDGGHIATLNPWFTIYYAVTGRNALGEMVNPGQQITRQEALRLTLKYSLSNAAPDTPILRLAQMQGYRYWVERIFVASGEQERRTIVNELKPLVAIQRVRCPPGQ
jgi:hypothetical protein